MRRILQSVIFVSCLWLLMQLNVFANNRFNTLTYHDHPKVTHLDSFFLELRDFGISMHYTTNPDSLAKYYILGSDTVDYDVYTSHFWESDDFHIGSNSTFEICEDLIKQINTRFNGHNMVDVEGYRRKLDECIGEVVFDDSLSRNIVIARAGIDDPGYLHTIFDRGVFQYPPKTAPLGEEGTFAATLKIGDNSLDDTVVVGQLILDMVNYWKCADSIYDPYATIAYIDNHDDIYIFHGSDSGWDTTAVLDSCYDILAVQNCYHSDIFASNTPWPLLNTCYVLDEGDTICSMPYKYIMDITISDFVDTSSYHIIQLPCRLQSSPWSYYAFKLYWTGVTDLHLDSLFLYNSRGEHFDGLVNDSLGDVVNRITYWYDNHYVGNEGKVTGLYIIDESTGGSFQIISKLNTIINNLPAGYPQKNLSPLGSYNSMIDNDMGSRYYDSYIYYSQESMFWFDNYPNRCWVSSSSNITDSTSFQRMLDTPGSYRLVDQLSRAITRAQDMGVDYGIIYPTFAGYNCTDTDSNGACIEWTKESRQFTAEEMLAVVNLALLYGAKGIGYYNYMGKGGKEYTFPDKSIADDSLPLVDRTGMYYSIANEVIEDFASIDQALAECDPCSVLTANIPPYIGKGLVHIDSLTGDAVPYPLWYDVRDINHYLDSMAYFFNNATWLSAGRWTDNIGGLSGSFIDSIKSKRTFPLDSAFIQVGFFQYNSDNYAYILNRRVQNDSTFVDSQIVSIFMSGEGVYEIWDIYANTCDTLWDSCGIIKWDIHLDPGEAILAKKAPIQENWHGYTSQQWIWDWPDYATINMDGDVTVYLNETLTIGKGVKLKPIYRDDETSDGYDNNMTELVVWGDLRIEGMEGSPVTISAPGDSVGWFGIVCDGTGKIYFDNVEIRHAKYGIFCFQSSNGDSIINCAIDSCDLYGIYSYTDDDLYIENCDIGYIDDGYGIYLTGSDDVGLNASYISTQHGIKSYYSSANIKETIFEMDSSHSSSIAVDVYGHSELNIDLSEINGYATGIKVGSNNNVDIEYSSISDTVWGYTNQYGIDASAALSTACMVRHNCFHGIQKYQVYSRGTNIDLGSDTSYGYNNYYAKLVIEGNKCFYDDPEKFIYNYDTTAGTTYAERNYFKICPSGYIGNYIGPGVDWQPTTLQSYGCAGGGGMQYKAISDTDDNIISPKSYSLGQNYPNPFNPNTVIEYSLPEPSIVKILVYNILGQRISTLVDELQSAGEHSIVWDGKDDAGLTVASGVYFYRIVAGNYESSKKMIVLK